jgi:hypothetical protein
MRKALWQFQYRGTRENFINYKTAEAKAGNVLKIKKESFINFTESLTRFTNPSYGWSKIKALKNWWNYCNDANEYEEENINEVRKMIDELYPPWAASTPPSP